MNEQPTEAKAHPQPVCQCGQTLILVGNATPGHVWRYCQHCDRPHSDWTSNRHCVACQLYAQNTSNA